MTASAKDMREWIGLLVIGGGILATAIASYFEVRAGIAGLRGDVQRNTGELVEVQVEIKELRKAHNGFQLEVIRQLADHEARLRKLEK